MIGRERERDGGARCSERKRGNKTKRKEEGKKKTDEVFLESNGSTKSRIAWIYEGFVRHEECGVMRIREASSCVVWTDRARGSPRKSCPAFMAILGLLLRP